MIAEKINANNDGIKKWKSVLFESTTPLAFILRFSLFYAAVHKNAIMKPIPVDAPGLKLRSDDELYAIAPYIDLYILLLIQRSCHVLRIYEE